MATTTNMLIIMVVVITFTTGLSSLVFGLFVTFHDDTLTGRQSSDRIFDDLE